MHKQTQTTLFHPLRRDEPSHPVCIFRTKKKSRVHPSPRIERLHDRRDLSEEPRLRVLVRDLHELILVLPRLVREPDPAVFDRHALDEREGELPVQPEPACVEGEDAGRGQHDDVVRAGDVCKI